MNVSPLPLFSFPYWPKDIAEFKRWIPTKADLNFNSAWPANGKNYPQHRHLVLYVTVNKAFFCGCYIIWLGNAASQW